MDALRPGLLRGFFADLRSSAQGGAGPTLMSDVPALPTYQPRSSVPSIALQAAQELVDRHYRLARWRSAPDRGRRRHPTLPEGVRQQGVRHQRASSGVWWADFRNNTIAIGDQKPLAAGGTPNILTQLILERSEANGAHGLSVATRGPFVKTISFDSPSIKLLISRIFAYRLSKPHAGAPAVLVDELGRPLHTLSGCCNGDPIRLHKEIGRNSPTCSDLLDHLEGQGPAPSQDFGRTRPRAQNVCKLRLTVTEFLNRIVQHVHRVKPPPALERPAPFLIRLDQRHENVELVTLCRPMGAPQSFSISASAARWSLSVRIGRICMVAPSKSSDS
jgi:hypothetical protein